MQNQPKLRLDLIEMRERWRKMPNYGCFWSSPDNSKGFRLTPEIKVGNVSVEMTIDREHSGFPGIAQGGVAFTILDGLMGWYVMSHYGRAGFTTQASVEYSAPLVVGEKYLFQAIQDVESENAPNGTIKLIGQVFHSERKDKPLLQMKASFFLPNRKTAQRVLGIPFGPEIEELFPES
jgi:acyl-coenzyme A thioesterase PaaI-like protein